MTTPHPSTSDGARTPLHVVLADDSGIFRQGLASLLTATGITVTASVASVEDLLAAVARDQPDIAIVDVRMPPTNTDEGIRAAAHLHRDHPAVGVLVLSTYVEARLVTRLLDAVPEGVGYLLKDRVDDVAALLGVMHRIAAGGIALYPEVVRSLSASGASISEEPSNSTERCVITPTRARRLEAHLARPFVTEHAPSLGRLAPSDSSPGALDGCDRLRSGVNVQPFSEAYKGRSAFASASRPPMTTRYVPFARSMAGYSKGRLRTDVVAGVTVAALALPASMAYAQLAGVPVSAGLYALLLPVLAYAFLGSAPRVAVGPEGTVALLVATAIAPLAASGSARYAALAAMLAVMVGVVYLVARVARIGWIADYFSQAVLVGYITGVAVVLILGQLGKLLGISSDENGAIGETIDILRHLGDANTVTVVVGALSIAFLVVAGRVNKRIPGALILVVAGIAASWALDLAGQGVLITGPVPSGLPGLEVPDLSRGDVGSLAAAALAVFLVAFSDSILTSRSFAARHHEVVDANQELLAFGVAQIAAGVTQGIPVGTSGSRTAVNDDMGATSQVSGLAAAGTIAAILMFLTAPIQYLPSAVLGAVIMYAGAKLIDPAQWQALTRSSRVEVVIAAITVACVVTVGVLQAIVVAVVLSVADIIRRAARPADAVLGWSASEDRYVDVVDHPDAGITAGVVVYRIQDRLFFANAHFFKRRMWAAVDGAPKPVRHVVLDGSFISDIDASAEEALREVIDGLGERNIELHLARATLELRDRLDSVGLVDTIGTDHFHGTVTAAVDACRPRADGSSS